MCNVSPSKFIGREVLLEISEPWDFRGDSGDIYVPGSLRHAGVWKNRLWAAVEISDRLGGDVLITSVFVVSRYSKEHVVKVFGQSNEIVAGFQYDPGGDSVLDLDVEDAINADGPYVGLIGSIALAKPTFWERLT